MYSTVRNGAAICLLVAAAAGTWYWSRTTTPPERSGDSRSAPLGYYLRDAVLLGTDAEGRIVYRISADLAEERPEDGSLMLSGVRVRFQQDQGIPWQLRAARGQAYPAEATLELEGDVELERAADEARPRTLVETQQLWVEPEAGTATASGDVRFTVGDNTLSATGLKAYLRDDRLELESKVHGRFVP